MLPQRGTLHDELERRKVSRSPLPQSSLVSVFHSICLAVRELHSAIPPLAHRDIKVGLKIFTSMVHAFSIF